MTTETALDESKQMDFVQAAIGQVGGTVHAATVVIGD